MSVTKTSQHFPYADPMVSCLELCHSLTNQADNLWDGYLP